MIYLLKKAFFLQKQSFLKRCPLGGLKLMIYLPLGGLNLMIYLPLPFCRIEVFFLFKKLMIYQKKGLTL